MLFSIVSVSAVCLALAINGWVQPDPQSSGVTSAGLLTFRQRFYQEKRRVLWTEGIVKWMSSFLSPLDVMTEQDFEHICSCRPTQNSDGTSLWLLWRTSPLTDVGTGVMGNAIDRLTQDIIYGVDFTISNLKNIIHLAENNVDDLYWDDNFLVATWRMTGTLPSIHIPDMTTRITLHKLRPRLFLYYGSWIPVLPLLIIALLREGRRRAANSKLNSAGKQKPHEESKILPKDDSRPQPAFEHGDFSHTFRIIDGKLVVQKLRENLQTEL